MTPVRGSEPILTMADLFDAAVELEQMKRLPSVFNCQARIRAIAIALLCIHGATENGYIFAPTIQEARHDER